MWKNYGSEDRIYTVGYKFRRNGKTIGKMCRLLINFVCVCVCVCEKSEFVANSLLDWKPV